MSLQGQIELADNVSYKHNGVLKDANKQRTLSLIVLPVFRSHLAAAFLISSGVGKAFDFGSHRALLTYLVCGLLLHLRFKHLFYY